MSSEPPASIWARPEPGTRGASHTREQIAAAAIALADAEGIEAVSMRRVAAELGAGTMTLYHYVKNKDELFELISDAIMGEVLIPDGEMPAKWRDAIAEVARRSHAAFLNHPWTVDVPPGSEGGPNGLKHFEQSLAAVAGTGLGREGKMDVVTMVDEYAFGSIMRMNLTKEAFGDENAAEDWLETLLKRMSDPGSGEFPEIKAFFADDDPVELMRRMIASVNDETRFERGLQILLDGIEARIESGW